MTSLATKLFQSSKTIFTNKDLALIWQENNRNKLNGKIAYYVNQKILNRLTRGVFAKTQEYDLQELATSIYIPSYISFETVLREAGIIFQHYSAIFIASKLTKTMDVDNHTLTYRKLKDTVLYNPNGIINKNNYCIAAPERAFLDMLYLFPNYYFDNLSPIDFPTCMELIKVYDNNQLNKRLNKYYKKYAK